MSESIVRIGLVFPELLGTYGDRGNAVALFLRLQRRSIPAEIVTVHAGDPVPRALDCYVIGGGENHTERAAATLLHDVGLVDAWNAGAAIVAVCAGFQLLGTTVRVGDGRTIGGVGLLDAATEPEPVRRVGDVVVDARRPEIGAVCGFENHAGATVVRAGPPPLGRNRDDGRSEGVFGARILGTYLHGPVLVRNPALADAVLEWIVGPLPELPGDDLAIALHDALVARTSRSRKHRR